MGERTCEVFFVGHEVSETSSIIYLNHVLLLQSYIITDYGLRCGA
jgi:hypothetical protein